MSTNTKPVPSIDLINMLGGTKKIASEKLECTPQNVHQWPEFSTKSMIANAVTAKLRESWNGLTDEEKQKIGVPDHVIESSGTPVH